MTEPNLTSPHLGLPLLRGRRLDARPHVHVDPARNPARRETVMPRAGARFDPGDAALTVTTFLKPRQLRVTLGGELDLAGAEQLRQVDALPLAGIERVDIDLTRLRFCDVAGMRALLKLRLGHERAGRRVAVSGALPVILRAAHLAGFDQLFGDWPLLPR